MLRHHVHLEQMCMPVDLAAQREAHRLSADFGHMQDSMRDAVLKVLRRQAVHGEQVVRAMAQQ